MRIEGERPLVNSLREKQTKIEGGRVVFDKILDSRGKTLFQNSLQGVVSAQTYIEVGERREAVVERIENVSKPRLEAVYEETQRRVEEAQAVRLRSLFDKGHLSQEEYEKARALLSPVFKTASPQVEQEPVFSQELFQKDVHQKIVHLSLGGDRVAIPDGFNSGPGGVQQAELPPPEPLMSSEHVLSLTSEAIVDILRAVHLTKREQYILEVLARESEKEPITRAHWAASVFPDFAQTVAERDLGLHISEIRAKLAKQNVIVININAVRTDSRRKVYSISLKTEVDLEEEDKVPVPSTRTEEIFAELSAIRFTVNERRIMEVLARESRDGSISRRHWASIVFSDIDPSLAYSRLNIHLPNIKSKLAGKRISIGEEWVGQSLTCRIGYVPKEKRDEKQGPPELRLVEEEENVSEEGPFEVSSQSRNLAGELQVAGEGQSLTAVVEKADADEAYEELTIIAKRNGGEKNLSIEEARRLLGRLGLDLVYHIGSRLIDKTPLNNQGNLFNRMTSEPMELLQACNIPEKQLRLLIGLQKDKDAGKFLINVFASSLERYWKIRPMRQNGDSPSKQLVTLNFVNQLEKKGYTVNMIATMVGRHFSVEVPQKYRDSSIAGNDGSFPTNSAGAATYRRSMGPRHGNMKLG